jgi:DNA polymerase-1
MSLDDVKLHLVDDTETAFELMRWLGTEDAKSGIGVDTETTGLQRDSRVRLVQIGGFVHGWSIPLDDWLGLTKEIARRYDGPIYMHNATYDQPKLERHGVLFPRNRIRDTMVMSHILEPNVSKALKSQSERYVDSQAANAQGDLDKILREGGWSWETVPVDFGPYWQYGALDPVLTRHLAAHHEPLVRVTAPGAFDLENSVQWVTYDMASYGAHIDVPYARQRLEEFNAYVKRAGDWVQDTYGVSAGSNAKIVELLQAEGYEFSEKTAGGAYKLDKEVLGDIDHPLAQTVLKRRQLQKLASTYLSHFVHEVDDQDCIHPTVNTLGARTGRMSMQDPNLQNLPRKSERNKAAETVRNCISARPGHTMLMCDFDQIEMRILAHLSGDTNLINAFHDTSTDFFVGLARQMFDDPTLQKKDPRRQITKNAGYSEIYGAGIPKFAATAGISEEQARQVKERWAQLYPGTKRFARHVESYAWNAQHNTGVPYYPSPVTGRHHVADPNKIYALLNYLIQGSAAEVFKGKLMELSAAGLGAWMVAPVHDEIILDVPNEHLEDAVQVLKSVMNDPTSYRVPISASVSYGQRWGAKSAWGDEDE